MAKQRLIAGTPDDIKASVAASCEAVELLRKMRPASVITATTGGRNTRVSLAALIGDQGGHQAPPSAGLPTRVGHAKDQCGDAGAGLVRGTGRRHENMYVTILELGHPNL